MPHIVMPPEGVSLKEVTAAYERQWIESALEAAGGVQKRAAELLRIKPTTLNEMIKRYDIRPRRKKAASRGVDAGGRGRDRRRARTGRQRRRLIDLGPPSPPLVTSAPARAGRSR